MRRMYFIGVTTGGSSIHKIFPEWTALAGIPDAVLSGIDIPLGGAPADYRAAVQRVFEDPDSRGALITTHKVQIYENGRDVFTGLDEDAAALGEVNCIVRGGGNFTGLALDTVTGGLAFDAIAPQRPFRGTVLIIGAGGAAMALAAVLRRDHRPAEVILTDISADRLAHVSNLFDARYELATSPDRNTELIESLPPGSIIVNASGVGKDRPGSPILPGTRFPPDSIAWDFNYRGELLFLDYARAQGARAVDGWEYFLHGWSVNLSRVYDFELTPELFKMMRKAASKHR